MDVRACRGHLGGRAREPALVVGLLEDVPARGEAVPLVVDDAVAAVVPVAVVREEAEQLHLATVPVGGLVVGVDDLLEGEPQLHLARVAAEARVLADELACGKVAVLLVVDDLRGGERLVGDVEVARLEIERGGVRARGVADVVVDRVPLHAVEAHLRDGVEVVRVGDEVLGPVDAQVVALVPRAIPVVLLDDVVLFAGRRVVPAAHVELLRDGEARDDLAVGGRARGDLRLDAVDHGRPRLVVAGAAVRAGAVGVVDQLVGEARDELRLGDLPPDAHGRLRVRAREELLGAGAGRDVDDRRAEVELGIVGGVRELVADEERLRQRADLHLVDRVALLRATHRERAPQSEGSQTEPRRIDEPHEKHFSPPITTRTPKTRSDRGGASSTCETQRQQLPVAIRNGSRRGAIAYLRPLRQRRR